MVKGKLNLELSFPIILLVENQVSIAQEPAEFLIRKRSYIPTLRKLEEKIIDADGNAYRNTGITALGNINWFGGFSLSYTGFGVCYVSRELVKTGHLSVEELKAEGRTILQSRKRYFGGTTLNIKKWAAEFKNLTHREDVLRYVFYFAGTSYYKNPDANDKEWRSLRGFLPRKRQF